MEGPSERRVEVGRWDGRDPSLGRLEALAWLLDNSIKLPGINYRVGLDALIGLVPVVGDLIGTALSAYILLEANRMGIPRATLLRMGFNVVLEAAVGLIPLVGDLFDFAWKANRRNLDLLKAHLRDPDRARKGDWAFAALFLLVAAGVLGLLGWGAVELGGALHTRLAG